MENNNLSDDEIEILARDLNRILLFEMWDSKTKAELHTYMSLKGIPYLVNDQFDRDENFWMMAKINGFIRKIDFKNVPISISTAI